MRINKNRFITACQQALAVGVVVAFLAPAANVVSLDVVQPDPDGTVQGAAVTTAAVPVASVEPEVTDYALAETGVGAQASSSLAAESHVGHEHESDGHTHGLASDVDPDTVVTAETSAPVEGYGAVGVTWSGEDAPATGELAVQVRTRTGDEWTDWAEVPFSDDHAPDVDSPDARTARGGTEPVIVGSVDEVEVRAEGDGALPADLQLSVVDPGAVKTRQEAPAITTPAPAAGEGDIALRSKSVTAPRPTIYSRAQWGADEKLRDKSSLRYGTVSAGFVHHTVNANSYTEAEVPGIIRSIYAYHTKSRGWSDVGYNFLVDRFGRIWEGRYGGVDKAVIGAHTLGYNEYSFAMSAIGNFETAAPSQATVNAYGSLMAWKLGIHGVSASATNRKVGKGTFRAINGHRDAGSTACPGKNLYAKLGEIRTRATSLQGTGTTTPTQPEPETPAVPEPGPQFSAPKLQSNLVGSVHPDIVVRRASDKKLFAIPTGGLTELAAPSTLYKAWSSSTRGFLSPDLTGDGKVDLVSITSDGTTKVRAGTGKGTFKSTPVTSHRGTRKHSLLVAAGDVNGDKRNDLVGRDASGKAVAFLRTKGGKFLKVKLNRTWKTLSSLHPVGDITGDGYPDLLARRKGSGTLLLIASSGPRSYLAAKKMPGSWNGLRDIIGGADFDRDGHTDIVFRNTNGSVWVLPGLGNGTFEPVMGPIATNKTVTSLSVAPVRGNGFPDVLGRSGKSVVVLKNTGKYEIGQAVSLKISMPTARTVINAGDWNRDGKGDIIAVRENGDLLVRTGDGMGGLSKATVIGTGFASVSNLQAVGDVSGDGFPDLVGTHAGTTKVFRGKGLSKVLAGEAAPGFKAPLARLKTTSAYDATQYDWKISVSDVRLAANTTDLVVRERSTGRLHVFENTTTGIGARRYLGRGLGVYDLAG